MNKVELTLNVPYISESCIEKRPFEATQRNVKMGWYGLIIGIVLEATFQHFNKGFTK